MHKPRTLMLLRFLLLLVLLASHADAQPIAFEPIGGPYYRGIVVGVFDDGELLGTSRSQTLLRSRDGGRNWDDVDGAPRSVSRVRVLPDGGLLLTATGSGGAGGGLFFSGDRGRSWANVGPPEIRSSVTIAVDAGGEAWAAALGASLLVTADQGATWTTIPPGRNPDPILSLAFDATGGVLVARYNDDAVASSVERWDGDAWVAAPTPLQGVDNVKRLRRLADGRVAAISYAYQSPLFSWFRRAPALYLSDDGGDRWSIRSFGREISDVVLDDDGRVVTARPGGVVGVDAPLPVPLLTALLRGADGTLYASSPQAGAFALAPGAGAWQQVGTYRWPLALAEVGGRLVAGGDGVLLAEDEPSWTPLSRLAVRPTALDVTPSGRLLLSDGGGVHAVDALGDAPRPLEVCGAGEPCSAEGVAVTASGALVAAAGCGLFRSEDDGASWARVLADADLGPPVAGAGLLIVGENSSLSSCPSTLPRALFVSTDDGQTWTRAEDGIADLRGARPLVTSTGEAYVGTYSGLYRRQPSGAWERLSDALLRDLAEWDGRVLAVTEEGLLEVVGDRTQPAGLDGLAVFDLLVRETGDLVASTADGLFSAPLAATAPEAAPDGEGLRVRLLSANPARGVVRIAVDGVGAASVVVEVLDVLGRRVAVLEAGSGPARMAWSPPAAGVYVVRAQSGRSEASARVTVVR